MEPAPTLSIVIPAKNEAAGLATFLPRLRELYPEAEIIVSDDGSTDETAAVARSSGATVLSSPYSMGNGAAIKRGARASSGEILLFMDADGQHDPIQIEHLLLPIADGFDMVVGARGRDGQANAGRGFANAVYNRLASWMTGFHVADLTSGLRAVRREKFLEFLHLLPNGFSYPTTITMAFFRSAYPIKYVPVPVKPRIGRSHLKPLRDGVRFLLIIFKIATLYSPLKLFAPVSAGFFTLGIGYYAYTFLQYHRFTNMSALLLSASVIVFLVGLVSEQVCLLTFQRTSHDRAR